MSRARLALSGDLSEVVILFDVVKISVSQLLEAKTLSAIPHFLKGIWMLLSFPGTPQCTAPIPIPDISKLAY